MTRLGSNQSILTFPPGPKSSLSLLKTKSLGSSQRARTASSTGVLSPSAHQLLPVDMQLPSVSVLSSWPTSNLINPETRGPAEIITVSVLLALVTILLCIRVYTRLWVSNGFGLDDVLILLAYVRGRGHLTSSAWRQTDRR